MADPAIDDLRTLRTRVREAEGPDRILDGRIMHALFAVPVGGDKAYLWPEDHQSWNFALVFNAPVSQKTKDENSRDAALYHEKPTEWIEWQREDGRWILMNALRVWELTFSLDAAMALVERVLPSAYYLLGKGRTRPTEPLYGFQILEGGQVVAETEHEDRQRAILDALLSALIGKIEHAASEDARA